MKNAIIILLLALATSCKPAKEAVPEPELAMSLEITRLGAEVYVKNTLKNAASYDLDYGDGTKIINETVPGLEALGPKNRVSYQYKKDGAYTITLTAYNQKGQSKTQSQVITVDYYQKNTSVTDFALVAAQNGTIKMTSLSSNYTSLEAQVSAGGMGFSTKTPNPIFELDLNGQYQFSMMAYNQISSAKDTLISIQNIQEREKGYFKGNWLGTEIETYETFDNQARTEYMDIGGGYKFMNNHFAIIRGKQGITISNRKINTDSLKTNQMKYEQIRSRFKAGIQNSENWILSTIGNPVSKSIEILEIREVQQKKIIPEMDSRAFWITYRIKADFGEYLGKIDGTLKMRYLIY
ncbi:PKD domain-containing protein [Emticicia sp. 21SJ11W-3]|uniref:PKD domain-containing protein n=1 Tax=Emticicia sp. 21SJ11W-3 TaxID=2916755 RepID=UPI00209D0A58|nr:PKD domain-containing protein [Emticicia sp. 21SJ11W-3]UTA66582.1 PKD domain-containing protein [Emticicia sp. 21SJ11W-3]